MVCPTGGELNANKIFYEGVCVPYSVNTLKPTLTLTSLFPNKPNHGKLSIMDLKGNFDFVSTPLTQITLHRLSIPYPFFGLFFAFVKITMVYCESSGFSSLSSLSLFWS